MGRMLMLGAWTQSTLRVEVGTLQPMGPIQPATYFYKFLLAHSHTHSLKYHL